MQAELSLIVGPGFGVPHIFLAETVTFLFHNEYPDEIVVFASITSATSLVSRYRSLIMLRTPFAESPAPSTFPNILRLPVKTPTG